MTKIKKAKYKYNAHLQLANNIKINLTFRANNISELLNKIYNYRGNYNMQNFIVLHIYKYSN
ncbi:MAG: hypothetical protein WBP82_09155 [Leuconostoc mesenteroides]